MAGNSGGPWGGGGNSGGGGDDRDRNNGGGRRPPEGGPQLPEIDELVRKGQDQLRVLMGGRGGGNRGGGTGGEGGPQFGKGTIGLAALGAVALWVFASVYTVKPEEQSVELFLGAYYKTGNPGLNFAPWPIVTAEIVNVTSERTEDIGRNTGGREEGLMLTTDANIVDIGFQVVWNISDPAKLLFNIRDPQLTVQAVSESVMREIIAASNLAPILNRDRGIIADSAMRNIQEALDEYDSGIQVVRVNLDKADPPREVIDSFREVQAAEQERDRLQRQADAYANRALAEARGQAAQILEDSEGYRARVVNEAQGDASRFTSVLTEYSKAPEVTRKRLYIETMERVLGDIDKTILDNSIIGSEGGNGVVPYLPLNELRRNTTDQGN
ncbi:protease FtsH subunit HflK [Roseovarius mucosus DSM 17069]|jgi:membrane protease subunit HflK|uniref:Protein HflK n=1 Tax=Roseovarius mucosus DSM 17069 TaxID=1288298 RepID=A0A0A0HLS3_9RHOB|nr:FtsH protease activity modulator HflK [Roseovarius mucosus]KGM88145.1 protease FtsH subunit HflK [Roseovarius mucosus DSM 17069]MAN99557.1 FtsH protease activity modulator HflK [Roseovarius sp.]|tara:strand:+ start:200 stop:1351 length:1152 start_codon:yes stop_codon:yes gene_type:complete